MFKHIIKERTDPVFEINQKFFEDQSENKQNLGIGEYRDGDSNPYMLNILKKKISQYIPKNLGYNALTGNQEFIEESIKLIFDENPDYIGGFQAPSGTGCMFSLFTFLNKTTNPVIYCPNITWENHMAIGRQANLIVRKYDYSSIIANNPDLEKFKLSLKDAMENDVILFQGCCHNPTGLDPSKEQWKEICNFLKEKKLIPIFDLAYYGFGDGLEEDLWAVRYFKKIMDEMFVCQSYSKVFGIYSERIGCIHIINKNCKSKKEMNDIRNIISKYTRAIYGCSPKYFSELIADILKNNKEEFIKELNSMRLRLVKMRQMFYEKLKGKVEESIAAKILKSKGFFHLFQISEEQLTELMKNHIYVVPPGRICFCGINEKNIDFISEKFISILKYDKILPEVEYKVNPDLTILITGAYGSIAKCLYPILLEKFKHLKIKLKLLGNNKEKTEAIKMQIEDCSFKNLIKIEEYYNDNEDAFKNVDLSLFCASAPYIKGCSRKDLFLSNKKILTNHSKLIEQFSKGCPILVVSNPVNSLATIVKENANNSNVICMTSLDEERGMNIYQKNVYIWGNHNNPKISDYNGIILNNKVLTDRGNLITTLSQGPSTFSVAKSLADLIYNWYFGSWRIHSIGICDNYLYDIPKNMCFTQPVAFEGKFKVTPIGNIHIDQNEIKESVDSINKELNC